MDAAGDIIMAWMLLWRAAIATRKLDAKDTGFYQGKIKVAQFFITTILPVTDGKLSAITWDDNPAVNMENTQF